MKNFIIALLVSVNLSLFGQTIYINSQNTYEAFPLSSVSKIDFVGTTMRVAFTDFTVRTWDALSERGFSYKIINSTPNAIRNIDIISELSSYPNPFSTKLNLSFSLLKEGPVNIEILDAKGMQIVAKQIPSISSGEHIIEMEKEFPGLFDELQAGVYYCKLTSSDQIFLSQVISK